MALYLRPVRATGGALFLRSVLASAQEPGEDTTPDQFAFNPQNEMALGVVAESNSIAVSGIDSGLSIPISVSNGEYAVSGNGGLTWSSFTANNGSVSLGNLVKVRHSTSGSHNASRTTTLTIGGVNGQFVTRTRQNLDGQVEAFAFVDRTSVPIGAWIESNAISVLGIDHGVNVSVVVSGGSGEYSISTNGVNWSPFTTAAGTAYRGNLIRVRHRASLSYGSQTNTTLTIGGVSDMFTTTTIAEPTAPPSTGAGEPSPWPATLPKPIREGYAMRRLDGRTMTSMETGLPRVRELYPNMPYTYSQNFIFSKQQYQSFKNFYITTLRGGSLTCIMPIWDGVDFSNTEVLIMEIAEITPISHSHLRVGLSVMTR